MEKSVGERIGEVFLKVMSMSEAEDLIRKVRIKFLYETPFFANLSLYLNLKEDKSIPSMAVDFKGNLLYNPEWVMQLSFEQLKTVVAHETLHLALQHLLRLEHRKKLLWNIAIDFAVNQIISEENDRVYREEHTHAFSFPDGILLNHDFKDMSGEQIYDKIFKNAKEYEKMITLDEHIYPDVNGSNANKGKDDDKDNCKNMGISERELRKERDKWKKRLVEATTLAKQMGKLPLGIERLVDGLLDSKINWKGLLYRYITQEIPFDLSYARPHKKSISVGVYMPYVVKENMDIVVAIDTSGSISERELKDFLSEITAIAKSFANITITLIVIDCKIQDVYELRNGVDLSKVKISGYGGTDFRPVFEWIKKNKPDTRLLVYFTDGYGNYPDEESVRTLWLLPRDYDVPFGHKIVIGDE